MLVLFNAIDYKLMTKATSPTHWTLPLPHLAPCSLSATTAEPRPLQPQTSMPSSPATGDSNQSPVFPQSSGDQRAASVDWMFQALNGGGNHSREVVTFRGEGGTKKKSLAVSLGAQSRALTTANEKQASYLGAQTQSGALTPSTCGAAA